MSKARIVTLEKWAEENNLPLQTAHNLYQTKNIPFKTRVTTTGKILVFPRKPVRSIKLNLKWISKSKKKRIQAIIEAYKAAVNFYIKLLWQESGKLDAPTLAKLQNTRLTERYKSNALRQAIDTVNSTRLSASALNVKATCPIFNGAPRLDAKFVKIEHSKTSKTFDTWITLSTLNKGHLISLPTKSTAVLNKWLAIDGVQLIQGCELYEDYIICWVELPFDTFKSEGDILAGDLGENKLLVDSNRVFYGQDEYQRILDKLRRRKPGSKRYQKTCQERNNYTNRILDTIPWDFLRFFGSEDLSGIKKGKSGTKKYKSFRKARAPWNQGWVRTRISQKAMENRVLPLNYDPRNTSRKCPKCNEVHKRNRQGELFRCRFCGYTDDADYVGATNGFVLTCQILGSLESPRAIKDGT